MGPLGAAAAAGAGVVAGSPGRRRPTVGTLGGGGGGVGGCIGRDAGDGEQLCLPMLGGPPLQGTHCSVPSGAAGLPLRPPMYVPQPLGPVPTAQPPLEQVGKLPASGSSFPPLSSTPRPAGLEPVPEHGSLPGLPVSWGYPGGLDDLPLESDQALW